MRCFLKVCATAARWLFSERRQPASGATWLSLLEPEEWRQFCKTNTDTKYRNTNTDTKYRNTNKDTHKIQKKRYKCIIRGGNTVIYTILKINWGNFGSGDTTNRNKTTSQCSCMFSKHVLRIFPIGVFF